MLGLNRAALIGGGVALAIALAWGGFGWRSSAKWHGKFDALTAAVVPVMVELRLASDNPTLKLTDAPAQIRAVGESRKAWKETADLQSLRIDDLGIEAARMKALNAEQLKRAKTAIAKRDTAIRRLDTERLSPGDRANCAQQLFDAEAALDLVYQEGL